MSKTEIVNLEGKKVTDVTLAKEVFGIKPNDTALYDAITLALNSERQGTHAVKTRDMVSGGGKKPWKQKGTGRARQGSIRAPQWYHGGIVFGPTTERNYSKKQNKKERKLAFKSALTYMAKDGNVIVIDAFDLKTNKTKDALKVLETLKADKKVLIVVKELNDNAVLATRNINNVRLLPVNEVGTLDIVRADTLVIDKGSLETLEGALK